MPEFHGIGPTLRSEPLWVSPRERHDIENAMAPPGRSCLRCRAVLSRWNRDSFCAPCEKILATEAIARERQLLADLEQMSHGTRAALMKHREARQAPCSTCKYAETQRRRRRDR